MRWSLTPGSSGRPGSPAPSCCACSPPTPTSTSPWPRPTPRPAAAPATLYPSLAAAYPDLPLTTFDARRRRRARRRVPRPARTRRRWPWRPQLVGRVGCVVDLSAAFRLKDAALYPQWYGFEHDQPELLAEAVYGLPERHRADLEGARLVATPGCYVTAATLALAPLLDAELIEPTGLIVDAASGVSGAGRAPTPTNAFCTVDENFVAYGLLDHRHTPGDRAEPRRPGPVHAAPGADEPGDPGHLLRPAGRRRRRCRRTSLLAALRAGLRRRAVRRRHRRLAVDEGHARLQRRPRHRPLRRAHRLRDGARAPSTT